jgi:tRNA-binding EMAP/Myf-like protein
VYYDPAVPTTGVVAGLVVAVTIHPNGQYIRLAEVDIGLGDKVQIVFGGPDLVVASDFVPVALPGARLPGRKKMRRATFRGERSHGMFCSAAELGWLEDGPDEVALLQHEDLVPGLPLDNVDWRDYLIEPHGWRLDLRLAWMRRSTVSTEGAPADHAEAPTALADDAVLVVPVHLGVPRRECQVH